MAKTIVVLFSLVLLLVGCGGSSTYHDLTMAAADRSAYAHEEGLRAGHADGKAGVCDHPFPREKSYPGYGHIYLNQFEEGYYKGCALARFSAKPVVSRKSLR